MIILSPTHLLEIRAHGSEAYPEECCGAILGAVHPEGAKEVRRIFRLENASGENRHRRFEITSDDYRMLEGLAARDNLTLLGFYHTHPDHPARPSQTDLSFAWPFFSYIILSVRGGRPEALNSFELSSDGSTFTEEAMAIGD